MYARPKIQRSCKACGTNFVPSSASAKFCSLPCRFWSKVERLGSDECWPWNGAIAGTGYGSFGTGTRQWEASHRVAYRLTHGELRDGMFVCHKCDNRLCCNPAHFFAAPQVENVSDMWRKNRQHDYTKMERGELRHNAKLSDELVREARSLYPTINFTRLARKYSVHITTISDAVKRRTWAHVA